MGDNPHVVKLWTSLPSMSPASLLNFALRGFGLEEPIEVEEYEKENLVLDIALKRKRIEFYDSLYCKNCGELLLGEDVWRFEGLQGFYCSRKCALKALRTCENCKKTNDGNKVFFGSQGNTYCSSGCLRAKEGV